MRQTIARLASGYRAAAIILLNTLVLFVFAELAAMALLRIWPARAAHGADWHAQYESAGWFAGRPWAADFWREHWQVADNRLYEPFTLWKSAPFSGRHVNVDADRRRVTTGRRCGPGSYRVFLFGGSTMWGWLAPDSGTIPSRLQALLDAQRPGDDICVENYGQLGYVTTQERIELERQLERGNVPDFAVFYDGWNDCDIASSNQRPGLHMDHPRFARGVNALNDPSLNFANRGAHTGRRDDIARLARRLALVRLAQRLRPEGAAPAASPAPGSPVPADTLAEAVAATYLNHLRMVDALAERFGFQYAAVLQPWLRVGNKPMSATESALRPPDSSPMCVAAFGRIAALTARNPRVVDLRGAFDQADSNLYLDEMHVTPDGNTLVAERIAALLPAGAAARRNTPRP